MQCQSNLSEYGMSTEALAPPRNHTFSSSFVTVYIAALQRLGSMVLAPLHHGIMPCLSYIDLVLGVCS